MQLFDGKICDPNKSFENLSSEGLRFITQLFNLVNESQGLISVSQIKLSKEDSHLNYFSFMAGHSEKPSSKNDSDSVEEIKLEVHPSKLHGTEIFWRIVQSSSDKAVIEKARDFLNKLYTALSDKLESQAVEIRSSFVETYLEKLSGLLEPRPGRDQMIRRMLSLMMDMIDESERKGTGRLKSHSALLKGQLLDFVIVNNVTFGKNIPKRFAIQVFSNTTIWEFKAEIGKYIESSADCVKMIIDNTKIKDSDNGKTLGEFIHKRNGTITLDKKNMDDIPKVALVTEDGNLIDKLKDALKEIFEKFAKDGKMDDEATILFIQNTTGESLVLKTDARVKILLATFGKENGHYVDLEGFINFYKDAIKSKKESLVRQNLMVYGFRNDLKRLNEVEETVIDITSLPRHILSCNPKSFSLLFRILDMVDASTEEYTWKLITRLTTNETIYKKMLELAVPLDENKQPMWSELIGIQSKYRLLYSLQIIESFLESDEASLNSTKRDWRKQFVEKGGFEFLLSIFMNQNQNKGICFTLTEKTEKFEKDCLGYIGKILNTFIRSAKYSLNGELLQEDIKSQNKLAEQIEMEQVNVKSTKSLKNEKNKEKEEKIDLKELFKAKPSSVIFLKNLDSEKTRNSISFSVDIDSAIANHIIEETKLKQVWLRQMDILFSIINGGSVNFFDNIVISAALQLLASCILIDNEVFTLAKNYTKDNATFEDVLIKGLVCEESQTIREEVVHSLGFLCCVIKDPKYNPLEYILKILLSNIPKKLVNNTKSCGEYFKLLSKLIEIYYETIDKPEAIDPKLFLFEFIKILKKHKTSKKQNNSEEDKLLIGAINIIRKILTYEPEMKEKVSLEEGLLHEVFLNCLFPRLSSEAITNLSKTESQDEQSELQKCKSPQSRSAAYKLLSTMCSGNQKAEFCLVKDCLEPLCKSIVPHNGWAYIPSSESRSELGYVGIENLGCICYMIAMIQQFYMIPTFRYGLLAVNDKRPPMDDNPRKIDDNVLHQLQTIFAHLELTEKQDYKPDKFCFAFKDFNGQPTNISIQQDAQEFLNLIFDRLENLLKNTPEKYLFKNVFGGKTCSQIICKGGCGSVRKNYEDFYNLSLGVKDHTTLFEALNKYVQGDSISGFNCEMCARRVDVVKRTCIDQLPNILIVHLQRLLFDYNTMMNEKINSRLEFPKEFSIEPYTVEGVETRERVAAQNLKNLPDDFFCHGKNPKYYEYKLVGVVVHYGMADAGHYYSYINVNRKSIVYSQHRKRKRHRERFV